MAITSPGSLKVAIRMGSGLGLKPAFSGTFSGEIIWTTRMPFLPSATRANIDALIEPICTAFASLRRPSAVYICSTHGRSGFSMSMIARPSLPSGT